MITRPRRFGKTVNESGFGQYDVQLEPRKAVDDVILMEFKAREPRKEKSLEETVQNALRQIEERDYASARPRSVIIKPAVFLYNKRNRRTYSEIERNTHICSLN